MGFNYFSMMDLVATIDFKREAGFDPVFHLSFSKRSLSCRRSCTEVQLSAVALCVFVFSIETIRFGN